MRVIDFGLKDYEYILNLQTKLFEDLINKKKSGGEGEEYVLIGEHPEVITLGRRAKEENVKVSKGILEERGVKLYHIGRGGDVTYHCKGEIILYPILDLEKHGLGVKDYVRILEETVIKVLERYRIKGERIEGATGVWVEKGSSRERKISAIGIKCNRFCTMHGLSLNVDCDLEGYGLINPCGFTDKGVASMIAETEKVIEIETIKKEMLDIFFSLVFPFEKILYFTEKL